MNDSSEYQNAVIPTKEIVAQEELCLNYLYPPESKLLLLKKLSKKSPQSVEIILNCWRDSIPYYDQSMKDRYISLLTSVVKCSDIDEFQRLLTAVNLLNTGVIDACYDCFASIAHDKSVDFIYRMDALKFLFSSQNIALESEAEELIKEEIKFHEIDSNIRYNILLDFSSTRGLKTYVNSMSIKMACNTSFVLSLYNIYFNDEHNDMRNRILAGQYLLQKTSSREEREKVANDLIAIASSENFEENIRADAADVVYRLGSPSKSLASRKILSAIGSSASSKRTNFYQRSQNVHETCIEEYVDTFLLDLDNHIKDDHPEMIDFDKITPHLLQIASSIDKPIEDAVRRVNQDSAVFTCMELTLKDILRKVWAKACTFDNSDDLKIRIVEELSDSQGTCSSGYAARLVNVFSGNDGSPAIMKWKDQIIANVDGRVSAAIRNCDDDDVVEMLVTGSLPSASEKESRMYKDFIAKTLTVIRNEMYNEFVGDGYITDEEFCLWFGEAIEAYS